MSKMKVISEKLQDLGLSSEDQTLISETIDSMVNEKVELVVEEEKQKLAKLADEFCEKKIEEGVEAEKEKLVQEYDGLLENLELELVEKLDLFLEMEISNKISEETLKSIAINETYAPIINGIKSLFEEKYVELDTEGHGLIKAKQEEVETLETQLAEALAEKMELAESAQLAAHKLLLAEKTKDLTESETTRVVEFFEGKSFDETKAKIDEFVSIVLESNDSVDSSDSEILSEDEIISEEECISESKVDLSDKDVELKETPTFSMLLKANEML